MTDQRYRLDAGAERHGDTVIAGSPLRVFRLTAAGARVVDDIAAGRPVAGSKLVEAMLDAGAVHPVPDSGPFATTDVTVVTPTLGPPAHVAPGAIVVDDGSRPPVADASITLEENAGPAAARNAGAASVRTPLVAFVDADVIVRDGWLDRLLPHFADDRVAAVAPRVASRPSQRDRLARYESNHSPLDLGGEPARVRAGSRVSYLPAAAIVCRADAVRSVGGFDESLRYGEDVDLVWRLIDAGWRVRYEPDVVVQHEPRADWTAWARQRIAYGSSTAPLATRHGRALAPLRASGWSVATWIIGVGIHPLAGVGTSAGAAAALVRRMPFLPPRVAFRLAWVGNLHAGAQMATAVRRAWWPLLTVAAVRSRTARRGLLLAAIAARSPIRLADDVMFSLGVWQGIASERDLRSLAPELTAWPGGRVTAP